MVKGRILAVDDEPRYLRLIRFNLETVGYRVDGVGTGEAALESLAIDGFDLVILDIMLPGLDGFEVCERIREVSSVPIIMLTAKDTTDDRVKGLRLGADDYITKPFSAQELLARVEAVLRRAQIGESGGAQTSFSHDRLHINFLDHSVRISGAEIHLSPTEYRLLQYLAINAGMVVTQDALLENVWGPNYQSDVLRMTVRRLRQRLEKDPANPTLIKNVVGVGYLLDTMGDG